MAVTTRRDTCYGRFVQSRARRISLCTLLVSLRLVLVSSLGVGPALAGAPEKARERATVAVTDVEEGARKMSASRPLKVEKKPAAILAAAELHLRTGQYEAAIDKLNQIVELGRQGKTTESTVADAEYFLGEAYFVTGQLYSARRHFEVVTDRAADPAFAGLGGPSASRLVDIALQIQRPETLEDVLSRVDRMLARSSTEALLYARAKALFALGRHDECESQSLSIKGRGLIAQRAAYLRGAALMKKAQAAVPAGSVDDKPDYRSAIAAFEQATVATTDAGDEMADARQITDHSWLAVARLYYESGDFGRAAVSYEKVRRDSLHFSRALFELAWTYVRLGDYNRGQRALEALAVLSPGLIDGADSELLRSDLLLRAGRFAAAEQAYEAVRNKYDPLRAQVQDYLTAHDDPAVYYDKLTVADIETGHELPALAIDWAREEAEEERVFSIVDDVAQSRSLIKRSRRIVTLLQASLSSGSRAKVFREVQQRMEVVVGLLNQLAIARLTLARGMDETAGAASSDLETVRESRRKLMARLGQIPTSPGDFSIRESEAEKSWNGMSQSLQRLQLEADHLKALVNGLRQIVSNAKRHGVQADEAALERFRVELAENEKHLAEYFKRIESLRENVEVGRVQSGFGDERFEADEDVRKKFRTYFGQEVQLAAAGKDRRAGAYAKSLQPLMARIATIEGRLEAVRADLDAQALAQADEMRLVVAAESRQIEEYASQLDTMDQHARLLVGEVARNNFVRVRDRIKDVVMRADVGLVQQAWEVREEQRFRVRDLLRERAQEERFINDELREVLDDAEEEGQ